MGGQRFAIRLEIVGQHIDDENLADVESDVVNGCGGSIASGMGSGWNSEKNQEWQEPRE